MQTKAEPERAISIMVVDDDNPTRRLIALHLTGEGFSVRGYDDGPEFLKMFHKEPSDIVILDIHLPSTDGLTLLKNVKEESPSTEVIMITGLADKANALAALRLGAFDMFEKPVHADQLSATIRRTVRYQTAMRERERLTAQVEFMAKRESQKWGLDGFIGRSSAIASAIDSVRRLQTIDKTPVLITGESGTGKELIARAIHYGGTRATRPFVPVNCSAIQDTLAESMLFGHVRGAFTGAAGDRKGCFELADHGTLFLDEIGDMHPDVQAKLLRVLEDETITPVGGTAQRKVDVRILAATNADLKEKVSSGAFRRDLYYRLAHYTVALPPLSARLDDLPELIEHFVSSLASDMAIAPPKVSPDFVDILRRYPFPGNIRELRNIVERAMIESGGAQIAAAHLRGLTGIPDAPPGVAGQLSVEALPLNLREAETILVERAVRQAGSNMAKAARLLGVSRTRLYRLVAGRDSA